MMQNALKKARKIQKTRPVIQNNFFMFADTSEISTKILYNLISTKTEYNTEEYVSFDRYNLTASQEQTFNNKFSPFVKSLIKYKSCSDFDYLLDFFVRNFYIQEYNKEELLFVILPFPEYNYQINYFANKLTYLQGMPKTYNHHFFATLAYKDSYFFDFILDYFNYYETAKDFLQKVILHICKLDQNEAILSRLYVVLEELVKNSDYEFFSVVYNKLDVKYELIDEFVSLRQKVQETDWYKNRTENNSSECCGKINAEEKKCDNERESINLENIDNIKKEEYKEMNTTNRMKILEHYKTTKNAEKINNMVDIMNLVELEYVKEFIVDAEYGSENISNILKVIDKNYLQKNVQKILNCIINNQNIDFEAILPFVSSDVLSNVCLDTRISYKNFIRLANEYNKQYRKVVDSKENEQNNVVNHTSTNYNTENSDTTLSEQTQKLEINNINKCKTFDINKYLMQNKYINEVTIEFLLQNGYEYTKTEFTDICEYVKNVKNIEIYLQYLNYVVFMIEKQKYNDYDNLKQVIEDYSANKQINDLHFTLYETMINNKIDSFDTNIKDLVRKCEINKNHAKLYTYIVKKDKKLINEIMNKQDKNNEGSIFSVFSDVLCFEDVFLPIKTYNNSEINEIQKNYDKIQDAITKTKNTKNIKTFLWYLLQLIENELYVEEITKIILDNKHIARVLLEFTTNKLAVALFCECITKYKDLLDDVTLIISKNPVVLLNTFYSLFTTHKELLQFKQKDNIIADLLNHEGYELEKMSVINYLVLNKMYDVTNLNRVIKYCAANTCVVLLREYKNILIVHVKDIINRFVDEYIEEKVKLYLLLKYKESNSIDEFVYEFVTLNHYEVIKAVFALYNDSINAEKNKILLSFLMSYLSLIDNKYIKQIVKVISVELKTIEKRNEYKQMKQSDTERSLCTSNIAREHKFDNNCTYNMSNYNFICNNDVFLQYNLLYNKLIISFILYCSKYEYNNKEMEKILSLYDFDRILQVFEQILPYSTFYFSLYITQCLEEINNGNYRSLRCVELYYNKIEEDTNALAKEVCFKLLTLAIKDKKYEKCFMSILNNIKTESILQEINKKILNKLLEDLLCFGMLERLYKNIPEYKICLKNSISYFTLCLDSKDSVIQEKTKKMLSKIQSYTDENIEEYFM